MTNNPNKTHRPAKVAAVAAGLALLGAASVQAVNANSIEPAVAVADTYNGPTIEAAQFASRDFAQRTTVSLERNRIGEVGWWATAWTSTPDGFDYYCVASPSGGVCHLDGAFELDGNPLQPLTLGGTPQGAVMLVAADTVDLQAVIDGGPAANVDVVDLNLESGHLIASVEIPDGAKSMEIIGNSSAGPFNASFELGEQSLDGTGPASQTHLLPHGPRELER